MYTDLFLLFIASFLSATILPAQSEIILTGLYLSGQYSNVILIATATFGNVLGSCINWLLGRYLMHFKDRKWFPLREKSINKSTRFFQKYGVWTLLFAWLPMFGDAFTLIAGVFRTNIVLFLILVTIGKSIRYVALLYIVYLSY